MAEDMSKAHVVIGEETFSLREVPSHDSALVSAQEKLLLGDVELESIVADLGRVGKLVRVAYNGVAGYTDLQIKIREIGYNVTILCDKSAVTVAKFKQASGSIIETLQTSYEFLLEGFDDMAVESLASMASVAAGMSEAAKQLAQEFTDESARVETTLAATMAKQGSEDIRKENNAAVAKKLDANVKKAQEKHEISEKDLDWSTKQYESQRDSQEWHEKRADPTAAKDVFNSIVGAISLGRLVLFDQTEIQRAKAACKDKLQHLKEMERQRRDRSQAIDDITKFTKLIQDCKDDAELAKVAVGALHQVCKFLKHLSTTMLKTAYYWNLTQTYCEPLGKSDMVRMVINVSNTFSDEQRIARWTSRPFKKAAISYYARWVALDVVCGKYLKQIHDTQESLYAYLTENPTLAKSREIVRNLAGELNKELKLEQEDIKKKDSEDKETTK